MKVTFTCEKCGGVVSVWHEQTLDVFRENANADGLKSMDFTCPACASITYGPLTEEMVAEALWGSVRTEGNSPWSELTEDIREEYRSEARFVLRLLSLRDFPTAPINGTDGFWRDWLLDLARK